jgi:putative ABC transport system permease protein
MQRFLSDLASGIRMLIKYPTLSLVAVLTLGVGIGLSTTVFSVVNGGLFKGLPFPHGDRIVSLVTTNPAQGQPQLNVPVHDLEMFLSRQTAFELAGPYAQAPFNISMEEGRPERIAGARMSVEAFRSLGMEPLLGRGFRPGDDASGAPLLVLLGHDLWRDRFGEDPGIVGRSIRADGVQRTVIGVMPPRFAFPFQHALWVPLHVDPRASQRGEGPAYSVVGLLKPDVSVAEARAQVIAIAAQLEAEFPQTNRGLSANVMRFTEMAVGPEISGLLYTMLGAGIGVLLIACVNVSNLLVARASLRRREVAVRMALGAARGRIVRQHLTEVLVLAILGGAIGVLLSVAGMAWFTNSLTVSPPPFWITFDLDHRILLFVAGIIGLACLAAGGLPALHAARVSAGAALKDDSRGSTSGRLGRFSGGLVVVELAVSCGLLIAAGLMIKSVVQLKTVPMPFAIDNVLTARVDLPPTDYPDSSASIRFFEQLLPRLAAVPGVEAATLSDGLPGAGNGAIPVQIEGKAYAQASDYPLAREGIVTPGYFDTFETPILDGREFTAFDTPVGQPVAIVNESFARVHFEGQDPIGRQFKRIRPGGQEPWLTVIGFVPDMLMQGIGNSNASPVGYYIPIAQSDVANGVRIAVRTRGEPAALAPQIRAAVADLDPDLAIWDVSALRRVIDRQTWFYTSFGTFFMAFGICALLLAAAGLYGVMSFAVTQRTREMGVRAALGAQGTQLIGLVMRRSVVQLAVGMALGLTLALFASSALSPILYKVDHRDAVVFGTVIVTLGVVSLLASFLPARRVTRIDPASALTVE